jgi:hypothetical protein
LWQRCTGNKWQGRQRRQRMNTQRHRKTNSGLISKNENFSTQFVGRESHTDNRPFCNGPLRKACQQVASECPYFCCWHRVNTRNQPFL